MIAMRLSPEFRAAHFSALNRDSLVLNDNRAPCSRLRERSAPYITLKRNTLYRAGSVIENVSG